MYQRACFNSAVAVCLIAAFADVALADVFVCAGPSGSVTFTDIRCMAGEDAIKTAAPGGSTRFKAQAAAPITKVVVNTYLRPPVKVAMGRALATDIATMKAAKEAIASVERVSVVPRPAFSTSY